jgi:hypothetical protein
MAAKLTQTNMIALLRENEARTKAGQPPLSVEDFLARLDAAAAAPQVVATMEPPAVDAAKHARNLEITKGILQRMTPEQRADMFKRVGVTDMIADVSKDDAAAQKLAEIATYMDVDLADLADAIAPQLVQGAGTNFFRKVQNEIGRTLIHTGGFMKSWSKIPILKSIIGPMGNKVGAEILAQTGAMLRGGSVRDWDDRAFVSSFSETIGDIGKGAAIAAPWLPAPWNAAAAALAAVCMASSRMMNAHIAAAEAAEAAANQQALTGQGAVVEPTDEQIIWAFKVLESSQGRAPGWTVTDADVRQAIEIAQSPKVQAAAVRGAGCGACVLAV